MERNAVIISLIGLLAILSPGPDCLLVLRNGLRYTRSAALCTALGISTGFCVHLLYCLLGLSALVLATPAAAFGLRVAGAAYLIWIGIGCLRGGGIASLPRGPLDYSGSLNLRAFREGLLCNLTNPKVALFLVGVLSQFITFETGIGEKLLYGAVLLVQCVLYWCLLALVVGRVKGSRAVLRYGAMVERGCGVLMLLFGGGLLVG